MVRIHLGPLDCFGDAFLFVGCLNGRPKGSDRDDRADFGNAFNPMVRHGCFRRGYIGLVCRLDKR